MTNPRDYPAEIRSTDIGVAPAERENAGHQRGWLHHQYGQPGWWASVDDPEDNDGQLIADDNLVRAAARRA